MYKPASQLKTRYAQARRIGRTRDIIDTLRNRELTHEEISARSNLTRGILEDMLPELVAYQILRVKEEQKYQGKFVYRVHQAGNIEAYKKDLRCDPEGLSA